MFYKKDIFTSRKKALRFQKIELKEVHIQFQRHLILTIEMSSNSKLWIQAWIITKRACLQNKGFLHVLKLIFKGTHACIPSSFLTAFHGNPGTGPLGSHPQRIHSGYFTPPNFPPYWAGLLHHE